MIKIKKNPIINRRRIYLCASLFFIIIISFLLGSDPLILIPIWISNFVPILLLSMAAAIVISCGNIDIAPGAIMSFLGMCIIMWMSIMGSEKLNVMIGHLVAIVICLIIYITIYGAIRLKIPSLIITLSAYFICKGFSIFLQACLQGAGSIGHLLNKDYFIYKSNTIPEEYVLHVVGNPIFAFIAVIVLVSLLYFWRFHTRQGLEHIAVGFDPKAAVFSGISCEKVYFISFLLAGIFVILATFFRIHGQTQGGWTPNTGWGEELLAIAIAVIGGTRITGGRFDPISILLSALTIYAMRDVVTNDFNLPSEIASMAFGITIVLVIILDSRTQKNN